MSVFHEEMMRIKTSPKNKADVLLVALYEENVEIYGQQEAERRIRHEWDREERGKR